MIGINFNWLFFRFPYQLTRNYYEPLRQDAYF